MLLLYFIILAELTEPIGTGDNNFRYINNSCNLTAGNGDSIFAVCYFNVTYYANNGTWTCNITTTDGNNTMGDGINTTVINSLIALNIPATIDYGIVDVFNSSLENETNVSNWGNVRIDISLDGYGQYDGDGNAMTCTKGSIKNISIEHEKFNASDSYNGGSYLNAVDLNTYYTNLSDSPQTQGDFDLIQRTGDTVDDAFKATYWRIYVPYGVGGRCQGNVTFTAIVG